MSQGKLSTYLYRLKFLQLFVLASPILVLTLRPNNPYFLPPIGPLNNFAAPLALLAALGCFLLLPGLILKSYTGAKTLVIWSALLAFISTVAYALLVASLVVTIHPVGHQTIYATVGTERTQFAKTYYPDTTNTEIAMKFGHRDEDLERLWTHASLTFSRVALLFAYVLVFIFLSLCLGTLAWKDSRKDNLGKGRR
jgi:hypothetical protein